MSLETWHKTFYFIINSKITFASLSGFNIDIKASSNALRNTVVQVMFFLSTLWAFSLPANSKRPSEAGCVGHFDKVASSPLTWAFLSRVLMLGWPEPIKRTSMSETPSDLQQFSEALRAEVFWVKLHDNLITVNPLSSPPGGLFISSPFVGGLIETKAYLKRRGA